MTELSRKIAVIDNDSVVREVLAELIRILRPDCEVLEAEDGDAGLELVSSAKPEIVLVDLNMPALGGDAMIRKLQAEPATQNIPFVLLTGEHETSARLKEIRPLCFSILQKPYTFDQLEKLFARLDQKSGADA